MRKKLLFLGFIFFVFTGMMSEIKAECSYEQTAKLKAIASNIQYDYSYVENNDKNNATFSIRFTNVFPQLDIYDISNNKTYHGNENNELIVSNLRHGNTYSFRIGMNQASITNNIFYYQSKEGDGFVTKQIDLGTSTCDTKDILTISIAIPSYNNFYQSDVCKKYLENKMCDKWFQHNFSYKDFVEEVEKLEKSKEKEDDENKTSDNGGLWEQIIEYFTKYYMFIVPCTIIVIGGVGYFIIKRKKDGFVGWE